MLGYYSSDDELQIRKDMEQFVYENPTDRLSLSEIKLKYVNDPEELHPRLMAYVGNEVKR